MRLICTTKNDRQSHWRAPLLAFFGTFNQERVSDDEERDDEVRKEKVQLVDGQYIQLKWNQAGHLRRNILADGLMDPGRVRGLERMMNLAGFGLQLVESLWEAGLEKFREVPKDLPDTNGLRHLQKDTLNRDAAVSEWRRLGLLFRWIRGSNFRNITDLSEEICMSLPFTGPNAAALSALKNEYSTAASAFMPNPKRNKVITRGQRNSSRTPKFNYSSPTTQKYSLAAGFQEVEQKLAAYFWKPSRKAKKASLREEKEIKKLCKDLDVVPKVQKQLLGIESSEDDGEGDMFAPVPLKGNAVAELQFLTNRFDEKGEVDLRGWQMLAGFIKSNQPLGMVNPGRVIELLNLEVATTAAVLGWTMTLDMLINYENYRSAFQEKSQFSRPMSSFKFVCDSILAGLSDYLKRNPELIDPLLVQLPIGSSKVAEKVKVINGYDDWLNVANTYLWHGPNPRLTFRHVNEFRP